MAEDRDVKTLGLIPCSKSTRLLAWQENQVLPGGYVSVANIEESVYGQYMTEAGVEAEIAAALEAENILTEQEIIALIQQYAGQGGAQLPIGVIACIASETPPDGWYVLDGSPVSEALEIGVYLLANGQASNGNGTVNLWDFRGRFLVSSSAEFATLSSGGEKEHTLTIPEMPPHGRHGTWAGGGVGSNYWVGLNSGSSIGGGLPHNNLPPYITINYIIYGG